ncbi:rRNA maturation RNase YbeY [Alphaproteobacteria bacterium LSUCC0684]
MTPFTSPDLDTPPEEPESPVYLIEDELGLAAEFICAEPAWTDLLSPSFQKTAATAIRDALATAGITRAEMTILLTDDAMLATLNADHRGKSGPTNVLSFPDHDDIYLGDIAMAWGVMEREAMSYGISMEHHCLHLIVHGVLHLIGHDHEDESEAAIMEGHEVAILARQGIPNPYSQDEKTEA